MIVDAIEVTLLFSSSIWASACLQSRLFLVASNHCASEIKFSWAKFYLNISIKFNQNKCHVELFVSALCICD